MANTHRRTPRGFTLVELLVVISVLGILTAVVVFAVTGFSGDASNAACATDAAALEGAEEIQNATTGAFADEAGLLAAQRIRSLSTLHDVVLTSDGYELVAVGACAEGGEVAAAPADDAAELAAKQVKLTRRAERLKERDAARLEREAEKAAAEAKAEAGTSVDGVGDGWNAVGAAQLVDGIAVLTSEKEGSTGGAFYGAPLKADGMRATFAVWSGKGGDGLTFALLDPDAGVKSLGKGGAGLGFAGLPGYAVTIDDGASTKKGAPFVGIANGHDGLAYLDTATDVGELVEGWHEVTVEVHGSTLVVSLDGRGLMKQDVKLPETVIVGFTGSTGDPSARQMVTKVQISA